MVSEQDGTPPSSGDGSLSDILLSEFEAQFRAGDEPKIEDFLQAYAGRREDFLQRLIELEKKLREEQGQQPEASEYDLLLADQSQGGFSSTSDSTRQMQNETGPALSIRSDRCPLDFGEYILLRKLGEGGMGVVYEAAQKGMSNRRLAIKTIRSDGDIDQRVLKRFQMEVEAVAQLEHRHIVPVYQFGEYGGIHFYVMKLIQGANLRQLVHTLRDAVSSVKQADDTQVVDAGNKDPTQEVAVNTKQSTKTKVKADSNSGSRSRSSSGWSKGETLASDIVLDQIAQQGTICNPLFIKHFVRMAIQICQALQHVHEQGLIHRDIKPANLLLDSDGDAWLTDFGLAMMQDQTAHTMPGGLVGTYAYMSPEQAMGSNRVMVDHRSDIYSFGLTLYELLVLRRAIPGSDVKEILRAIQFDDPEAIRQIDPLIPKDLETIVSKAMAKDPNQRFQSAEEMEHELQLFQAGKPLTIRPPSLVERAGYWMRANPTQMISAGLVALVLCIASVITAGISVYAFGVVDDLYLSEQEKGKQLERTIEELEESNQRQVALRLASDALRLLEDEPEVAFALARESARRFPSLTTNSALMSAIDSHHELVVLGGKRANETKTNSIFHAGPIGHVAFNQAGTQLVSCQGVARLRSPSKPDVVSPDAQPDDHNAAILWDLAKGTALHRLNHTQQLTSACFTPDDRAVLAATGAYEAVLKVANLTTATEAMIFELGNPTEPTRFPDSRLLSARANVISPDGLHLILPMVENRFGIFSRNGELEQQFSAHESAVFWAGYSGDGRSFFSASIDGTVKIWDAERRVVKHQLKCWGPKTLDSRRIPQDPVTLSEDGHLLLVQRIERTGHAIWELDAENEPLSTVIPNATTLQFCRHGESILASGMAGGFEQHVKFFDGPDLQQAESIPAGRMIQSMCVSQDGRLLTVVALNNKKELHLWDRQTTEEIQSFSDEHAFTSSAIDPSSRFLAAGCVDGSIKVWRTENGAKRRTLTDDYLAIFSPWVFDVAPQGSEHLVLSWQDSKIVFEPDEAKPVKFYSGRVRKVSMRDSSSTLTAEGSVATWRRKEAGKETTRTLHLLGRIDGIELSPLGNVAAIDSSGDELTLLHWSSGRRIRLPKNESDNVEMKFHPSGEFLCVASLSSGKLRVWNVVDGQLAFEKQWGKGAATIKFSSAGGFVAVKAKTGLVQVFRTDSLEPVLSDSIDLHEAKVQQLSHDGKFLVSLNPDADGALAIWSLESGEKLRSTQGAGVRFVTHHPQQSELLVGLESEGIKIYRYLEDEWISVTDRPFGLGGYAKEGGSFWLISKPRVANEDRSLTETQLPKPAATRWSRESLQQIDSHDIPGVKFGSQDGIYVGESPVFSGTRYGVKRIDPADKRFLTQYLGHRDEVTRCFQLAETRDLITVSKDGAICLWKEDDPNPLTRLVHGRAISASALSADQSLLVTGAEDGSCCIWELSIQLGQQPVPRRWQGLKEKSHVSHLAFHPDGQSILALFTDHRFASVDVNSAQTKSLNLPCELVEWAEYSPDGNRMLVLPWEDQQQQASNEVFVRDLQSGKTQRIVCEAPVQTAHFDGRSQRILVAVQAKTGEDRAVLIYRLENGRFVLEHELNEEETPGCRFAIFSPDSEFILTATARGTMVWRVSDAAVTRWIEIPDSSWTSGPYHQLTPFFVDDEKIRFDVPCGRNEMRRYPLRPATDPLGINNPELTESDMERFKIPSAGG